MSEEKTWAVKLSNICLPQRYIVTFFGLTAIMNCYTMRNSLSITITQIVKQRNNTEDDHRAAGICEKQEEHLEVIEKKGGEFNWSQDIQGQILSSFYIGYIITQIPGGILSDLYGAKWVLNICVFVSAILSFLTPPMIQGGGASALIGIRVLMGLVQGVVFPACSSLMARWAPIKRRSLLGAIVLSGGVLGQTLGQVISANLLLFHNWEIVFYVSGISGILWCLFFTFMCYSDPYRHPYISPTELEHLELSLGKVKKSRLKAFPWKQMFQSDPVRAFIFVQIGHDWGLYVMATDLPKYMYDVLQFNVLYTGISAATPFLCNWLAAIVSGITADFQISSGKMSITAVRKVHTFISQVGPSIFMVAASYAGCDKILVVTLFTISLLLMGPCFSGMQLTPLDLCPNYAGTVMAIGNSAGAVCGYIAPWLVREMTPNGSLNEWRGIFQMTAVILCSTGVIFCFWGSGDPQPWNEIEDDNNDD